MNNAVKIVCFTLLGAAVLSCSACKGKQAGGQMPAQTVNAIEVVQADLPWDIEYPAQVAGSLQVNVRAQVGGILQSRLFDEGAYVKEGTQLFQIDDKEYKAALERARGSLAQAEAQERSTQREYNRMKKLLADKAVSQKNYDDALSAYETAQANVQVAKAGVTTAKINFDYTKVKAPISGIMGKEAQSVGSLVSPTGESGFLTTMVQANPLWVNFSMPGSQFAKLASGYMSGQIVLGDEKKSSAVDPAEYRKMAAEKAPLYVEAILANGKVYAQKGKIIFFDSTENTQTSSLAMRAEFANPKNDRQLMPGQFVRVRLVGAVYKNAILVPSSAILNTPEGMLTYVVDSNNTVAARPVKGELQNNMYIISEGLKHGEKIVSNGLIKLKPGMQVTVNLQKFTLPATAQTAQPASQDGRSVASLEATIDKSVAPDAQALPNDQQGK